VHIEMPAVAKEIEPYSTETRQVICYVQSTAHKQVWISLADVPWLVRVLHDQAKLGGVSLIPNDPSVQSPKKTRKPRKGSTGEGNAVQTGEGDEVQPDVKWNFELSAWVVGGEGGEIFKPDEISAYQAAIVGVDEHEWSKLDYKNKKEVAYKLGLHSLSLG
jgi:hypothetical protein